eukprot:Hpha_TRINITY_DN5076_c0_g1::TRINITY_DN5076_c0_g1_i1::g.94143::m.94143
MVTAAFATAARRAGPSPGPGTRQRRVGRGGAPPTVPNRRQPGRGQNPLDALQSQQQNGMAVTGRAFASAPNDSCLRRSGILFTSATLRGVEGRWHGEAYDAFVKQKLQFPLLESCDSIAVPDQSTRQTRPRHRDPQGASSVSPPPAGRVSATAIAAAAVSAQRRAGKGSQGNTPRATRSQSAGCTVRCPPPERSDSPEHYRAVPTEGAPEPDKLVANPFAPAPRIPRDSLESSAEPTASQAREQLQYARRQWRNRSHVDPAAPQQACPLESAQTPNTPPVRATAPLASEHRPEPAPSPPASPKAQA